MDNSGGYQADDFGDDPVARLAQVNGVTPDQAAGAVQNAPAVGMPPSTGMLDSDVVARLAQQREQTATVRANPPVAQWAATAEPAHLAATQDDLPALAKVGNSVGDWLKTTAGNPLTDIGTAAQGLYQEYLRSFHRVYDPKLSLVERAQAEGSIVKDVGLGFGALAAPMFTAIATPVASELARGFAPFIKQTSPLFPWEASRPLTTPEEKLAEANRIVNTAFFGAKPVRGVLPVVEAKFREVPPEGPQQLALSGPGGGGGPEPVTPENLRAKVAETDHAGIEAIQERIAASATHGRSPAVMENFIAQQTGARTVAVDADKLLELAQQGHEPFPEHVEEIVQAAQDGEPVVLPLARYLARTSGEPFAGELNAATAFREGGLSLDEAKEQPTTPEAPIVQFRRDFAAVESTLPAVQPGFTRLYRGNRPGEVGQNPSFTNDAAGIALPFRKAYGGDLSYVDVPTADLDKYESKAGAAAGAEFQLPPELAAKAQVAQKAAPTDLTPDEAAHYRSLTVASDTELDQIVQDQRLRELFTEAKAVGATKDQFDRYNAGVEEAIAAARERLYDRAHQAILRERKEPFQTALAQHSAEVERELAQTPAIRARAYLAQGRGPLGEPIETPFKLDREDAVAKYGRDLGLPDRYFGRNGVSADEAAEVLGFQSGADMVRELAALHEAQGEQTIPQHMKALVREMATNRAREELGFDLSPEALHNAASEAITAPAIADFLAEDLQRFADEHGLPFDKEAMKTRATERFNSRPVREAINVRKLEGFLAKDNRKIETALLKGDVPTAFRWKQAQFLHQLELVQAHKFLRKYAQAQRLFKRVAGKVTIKSVSQDALNWSKDVLASTGMAVKGNPVDLARPIGGHLELSGYVGEKNNEGADILQVPVARVPLSAQTVAQFRGIADMVRAIMTWGKKENEATLHGKTVALSEAIDRGIESLARYTRFISDEELHHPNMLQAIDAARRNVDAWLVRTEQLLRDFGDKDFNSPFFQIVTRELQAGRAYSMDKRLALAKHFHAVAKAVGGGFDKWLKAKLPANGIHTVVRNTSGGNLFITNRDIMVAALHLGDQGALDAFTGGYNTDAETVQAIVNAHATREMWTTVRGILDAFEQLKPDIVAKYRGRTGVTPTLVEARPFKQADGTVNPGGYFPISHGPAKLLKDWIKQNEAYTNMLGSPHYQRVSPNNAYTIARTGSKVPVSMSLDSVYSRLNQTIHDLAYRDALAASNRFLLHPRMQEAISRKYGPEYVTRLKGCLQDIAGAESVNPSDAMMARAFDFLSERQQITMIGFSPPTMIKHGLTAQFQALHQVGAARYAVSLARVRLQPSKYRAIAEAESADVRHILSTYNEDAFRQFLRATQGKFSITRAGLSWAFHLVGYSNRFVAVPLYDAAKLMVREKNPKLDKASVQAAAGQLVRQALGSSGPTESSRALRIGGNSIGGKFLRLTNPFMSFLNHMYNITREVPQNLGYAGQKVNLPLAFSALMIGAVIPTYIDQAMARRTFKMGKDAAGVLGYWAEGLLHQFVGGVPVVNSAAASLVGAMDKSQPSGETITVEEATDVGKAIHDMFVAASKHHPMTQAQIHNVIMAGALVGPVAYPGLLAVRLQEFFHKLGKGAEHEWQTVLHDLTLGPAPGTTK